MNSMNTEEIIEYLQRELTDPVPRYLLLREIRQLPKDNDEVKSAYQNLTASKWYRQLKDEQLSDGSWGRFHSQDTKLLPVRKFVTTEMALRRMKEIGLDKDDPMVDAALRLLGKYLTGEVRFPDRIEHHLGFEMALKTMAAANIRLFDEENAMILEKKKRCAENISKAFINGIFQEQVWEAENQKTCDLYLQSYTAHIVWLLGKNPYLSDVIQRKFFAYISNRSEGIYYISGIAPNTYLTSESRQFDHWLRSLEALGDLSLFFEWMNQGMACHLCQEIDLLMKENRDLPSSSPIFGHYSEKWSNRRIRKNDRILSILRLLKKCRLD